MTSTSTDKRPSGLVIGSLIALSFGTVFIMVNSGGLPSPWPLLIRLAGAVAAAVLLIAVFRKARTTSTDAPPPHGLSDRRFGIILAAEAVALFGGLYLIVGVWDRPELGVAWTATVVGIHFFGLAWAWRMPFYHWLGAAMTALGLAGFVIAALGGSDAAVGLVAGVGSGIALYATVAYVVR